MSNTQAEILEEIKSIRIPCPECGHSLLEDDQYTCTTCWAMGGGGKIHVYEWLQENKKLVEAV